MRRTRNLLSVLAVLATAVFIFQSTERATSGREGSVANKAFGWVGKTMTAAQYDEMMQEISNNGRWGKDDKLGALNLITSAKRKQAAALVKTGTSMSIGHDLMGEAVDNKGEAFKHVLAKGLSSDTYYFDYHGGNTTHMDAGCHGQFKGKRYNAHPIAMSAEGGCGFNTIHDLRNGVVTRAVLIDVPRLKGVAYLEPGKDLVYAEDIEAWEKKVGVKLTAGDAILLRTGRWTRRAKVGPWDLNEARAGYHASVGYWFKSRDIALFGSDTGAGESIPTSVAAEGADYRRPMHTVILVGVGGFTLEHLDIEELAEVAAKTGVYEFMLTLSPMRVRGGTGSPINPVVTF